MENLADMPTHRLMILSGRSKEELAEHWFGRNVATVESYARGRSMDPAKRHLLEILAGAMPWRGFEQFTIKDGLLFTPGAQEGLRPEQLANYYYALMALDSSRKELQKLKSQPVQYLIDFGPDAANDHAF